MDTTDTNLPVITFLQRVRKRSAALFLKFQQKHLVFIFFVLLSALAWYMRALSEIYIADIEYPVNYINLPPNRMLSQEPPSKLNLRVQADGYTILSSRIKFKRPLSYNVNAFALYSLTEDSTTVYTLTWYARERLSAELGLTNKNIQILDIKPDTLIFNFTRIKRKKVPIKVVLEETQNLFRRQFTMNGIPWASPDSIIVTGPSYSIDTLSAVLTMPLRLKNLSDTVEKKVKLIPVNRHTYSLKKVKVIIPVDEFTESKFEIPVNAIGVPDSLLIKTFPKTVQVKYIITLSHFNEVTPELFHAYIDYSLIDPELSTRLKVELDSVPPFLHNISISPRSVEFLIEHKNAEDWAYRRNR